VAASSLTSERWKNSKSKRIMNNERETLTGRAWLVKAVMQETSSISNNSQVKMLMHAEVVAASEEVEEAEAEEVEASP
jgi:hypothetical protein